MRRWCLPRDVSDGRGSLYQFCTIKDTLMRSRQIKVEPMKKLSLSLLPHKYAVCQFHPDEHIPYWALLGDFVSLTRTPEELSIVCQQDNVPGDTDAERGCRCVQVQGAFDFSFAAVLPSLPIPLSAPAICSLTLAPYPHPL